MPTRKHMKLRYWQEKLSPQNKTLIRTYHVDLSDKLVNPPVSISPKLSYPLLNHHLTVVQSQFLTH